MGKVKWGQWAGDAPTSAPGAVEKHCGPLVRKARSCGNWELRETSWATVLSLEVFPLNVLSQLHWSFSLINPTCHQVLSDHLSPPSLLTPCFYSIMFCLFYFNIYCFPYFSLNPSLFLIAEVIL